ncbi:hypothetical protein RCO27_04680 [Sphingosinicella sp. LHD-64]|uniref:hypothetical protein n=1 Tax=Sphingosinicella sp. LHD-64 TaxID=3072139 RepID=UPI00280FB369|nr:hypothetical protein [Sphingosinicella sp. LHD-64]MDQ8755517.1 hypothetical protein [Sphingosinicella sp. LHD-64]
MRLGTILLAVSALLTSACASSSYPPLVSIPPVPPADEANQTEIDRTLTAASELQSLYEEGYLESAQVRDLSQLPIIGAAAIAALILLDSNADPTDAARFGVFAGAYTAGRDQLNGTGLTDAYIAGHGALTCVLAEGSNFAGTDAQTRYSELDDLLQDIANQIADVLQERWTEPTNSASQAEALRLARAMADQAITAARTAETAALVEQAAYRGSPTVFRNAVASISVRVASRGRVRPAVDFATLRDAMAPAKAPDVGTPQGANPMDVASVIQRIVTKTSGLITLTARLSSGMPSYSQSLDRVAACPDQIR